MRVLGLVPARGGSKGIPRKNIRPLAGKPLLQYTAEAALGAGRLSTVVLSTEDEEIADVGRTCGLRVPFLRPKDLAEDTTATLPVVQHAVRWLERNGESFDAVCLLQPTNPLRRAVDIDSCLDLLEQSDADAVISVLPVPAEHNPLWVYFEGADGTLRLSNGEVEPIPRRQELPNAFHRDGSVYATKTQVVMQKNSLYGDRVVGYLIDPVCSVNIDGPEDWDRAVSAIRGGAR